MNSNYEWPPVTRKPVILATLAPPTRPVYSFRDFPRFAEISNQVPLSDVTGSNGALLYFLQASMYVVGSVSAVLGLVVFWCIPQFRRAGNCRVPQISLATLFAISSLLWNNAEREGITLPGLEWFCRLSPVVQRIPFTVTTFTMISTVHHLQADIEHHDSFIQQVNRIWFPWIAAILLEYPTAAFFTSVNMSCALNTGGLELAVVYMIYTIGRTIILVFAFPAYYVHHLWKLLKVCIDRRAEIFLQPHHGPQQPLSIRAWRTKAFFFDLIIGIYFFLTKLPLDVAEVHDLFLKSGNASDRWETHLLLLSYRVVRTCIFPILLLFLNVDLLQSMSYTLDNLANAEEPLAPRDKYHNPVVSAAALLEIECETTNGTSRSSHSQSSSSILLARRELPPLPATTRQEGRTGMARKRSRSSRRSSKRVKRSDTVLFFAQEMVPHVAAPAPESVTTRAEQPMERKASLPPAIPKTRHALRPMIPYPVNSRECLMMKVLSSRASEPLISNYQYDYTSLNKEFQAVKQPHKGYTSNTQSSDSTAGRGKHHASDETSQGSGPSDTSYRSNRSNSSKQHTGSSGSHPRSCAEDNLSLTRLDRSKAPNRHRTARDMAVTSESKLKRSMASVKRVKPPVPPRTPALTYCPPPVVKTTKEESCQTKLSGHKVRRRRTSGESLRGNETRRLSHSDTIDLSGHVVFRKNSAEKEKRRQTRPEVIHKQITLPERLPRKLPLGPFCRSPVKQMSLPLPIPERSQSLSPQTLLEVSPGRSPKTVSMKADEDENPLEANEMDVTSPPFGCDHRADDYILYGTSIPRPVPIYDCSRPSSSTTTEANAPPGFVPYLPSSRGFLRDFYAPEIYMSSDTSSQMYYTDRPYFLRYTGHQTPSSRLGETVTKRCKLHQILQDLEASQVSRQFRADYPRKRCRPHEQVSSKSSNSEETSTDREAGMKARVSTLAWNREHGQNTHLMPCKAKQYKFSQESDTVTYSGTQTSTDEDIRAELENLRALMNGCHDLELDAGRDRGEGQDYPPAHQCQDGSGNEKKLTTNVSMEDDISATTAILSTLPPGQGMPMARSMDMLDESSRTPSENKSTNSVCSELAFLSSPTSPSAHVSSLSDLQTENLYDECERSYEGNFLLESCLNRSGTPYSLLPSPCQISNIADKTRGLEASMPMVERRNSCV